MKVLVVALIPLPLSGRDRNGIQRRIGVFLRALGRLSTDITLLHILPAEQIAAAGPLDTLSRSQSAFWGVRLRIALVARRPRRQTWWAHYGAGIFDPAAQPGQFAFGGRAVVEGVRAHLDARPDLVLPISLSAMLPILEAGCVPPGLVFDLGDIPHRLMFRQAVSAPFYPGKAIGMLHLPALMRLERRAVKAARLTFVCSGADRAALRRLRYGGSVDVVPNALAVPDQPPGLVASPSMLLLGDMRYEPNAAAADRLVRRIWPLIRRAIPGATLTIAGFGSDGLASARADAAGVAFPGFVDDLDALYARSRVVCCPIMTGGGTRLKLVEAASYARPMVSTTVGAEGLDFVDGQHILLRDDDAGFAAACVELLRDDALCRRLGAAAREVMIAQYDARLIERQIADMIGELQLA